MTIEKLLDIRQRLSTLVQTPEGDPNDHPVSRELTGIIHSLDVAIAELRSQPPLNTAEELLRTTGKPLEPPKPGPHQVDWGLNDNNKKWPTV